jgi:hypothetical protein
MKYAFGMICGGMMYIPSFLTNDSGIHLILYHVRAYSISSDHQLYSYSTVDAVRIVNSFITIPITRDYNHTIISYAGTHLHNYSPYTFVTKITYSTLARLHSLRALHSSLYCTIAHKAS